MKNLEYKDLNLWTSYVTPDNLKNCIEAEILPIFIARSIYNSGLIGKWHGTSVHFGQLAPSPELLRKWKKDNMSLDDFEANFREEQKKNNFEEILQKISLLCSVCNAKGAVLFGYGKEPNQCHRSIISKIINETGLLNNPIIEL